MIKVNIGLLEKQPQDLEGEEPAEFLDIEPSSSLAILSGVQYRLHASLVSQNVLIQGAFSYRIGGTCGRCLKEVEQMVDVDDLTLYVENPGVEELDVSNDFREEVLLALPVNLLCSDDCAGLCPLCGADRNEVECGCEPPEIAVPEPEDNPWAALDDLKLQ